MVAAVVTVDTKQSEGLGVGVGVGSGRRVAQCWSKIISLYLGTALLAILHNAIR